MSSPIKPEPTTSDTSDAPKQKRERPKIEEVKMEEIENPENQNEFDPFLLRKIPSKSQYDKQDMNPYSIKLSTFDSIYDGVVEDGRNDRVVLKNIEPKSKERGIYYVLPTLAEVVIPFPFQQGNEKIITLPVNDPRILTVLDRMRILGIPFDVPNKNTSSNVLTIRKFMTDIIKGVQKTFFLDTESIMKLAQHETQKEEDSKNTLKEIAKSILKQQKKEKLTTSLGVKTETTEKKYKDTNDITDKVIAEFFTEKQGSIDEKLTYTVKKISGLFRSIVFETFMEDEKKKKAEKTEGIEPNDINISEDEINRITDRFMAYIFDGASEAIHEFVLPEIESFIMGCPNPFVEKRILSRNFALLEQAILDANKGKKDIFLPGTTIDPNTGKNLTRKMPPPAKLTLKLKMGNQEKSYPDILRNWTKEDRSKGLYYKEEENPNDPKQKQLNLYYLCTYPEEMKFSWVPAEYKDIYENYGLVQHAYMNRDQFFQSYTKIEKMKQQKMTEKELPDLEETKKEVFETSQETPPKREGEKMASMTIDPYLIRVGNRLFKAETKKIQLDWENQGFLDYGPEDRPTLREFINSQIKKKANCDWWDVYPLVYLMYNLQPPKDRDRYALVSRNLHPFQFNNKNYVVMGGDTPMKYIRRALVQLFGENDDKKKLSRDAKTLIFYRNIMKAIRNSSAIKLDSTLSVDSETVPLRYQKVIKAIYDIEIEKEDTAVPASEFLSKLSEQSLQETNQQFRENDTSFGDRFMQILQFSDANKTEAIDIIKKIRTY